MVMGKVDSKRKGIEVDLAMGNDIWSRSKLLQMMVLKMVANKRQNNVYNREGRRNCNQINIIQ